MTAKRKAEPKMIMSVEDLIPDPKNARRRTERNVAMIEASLREVGAARSLVVNEKGVVLSGNGVRQAALSVGIKKVRVVDASGDELVVVRRSGLTKRQQTRLALYDNQAAALAEWEDEVLAVMSPEELDGIFTKQDLQDIIGHREDEKDADEFDADEAVANITTPVTKAGDTWLLGRHRLRCGDAVAAADVDALCDGAIMQMVYTDPPYGIDIVSKGKSGRGTIGGDKPFGKVGSHSPSAKAIKAKLYVPVIGDESTDTALAAHALCAERKIPVQIWWGGNHYASGLPNASCWIVWDKESGESFLADAELAWTNMKTAIRIFRHKWNGLVKASERGQPRVHPTQKPVALAVWCMEKFGKVGDNVLDLFGGSGSTLIACEETERNAFVMEMSPAYCDVIVQRFDQRTGDKAKLEGGRLRTQRKVRA